MDTFYLDMGHNQFKRCDRLCLNILERLKIDELSRPNREASEVCRSTEELFIRSVSEPSSRKVGLAERSSDIELTELQVNVNTSSS